ncbi:hypothetical protein EMIHUDRAFT_258987 [Emiliania huxleyi CCMP1516]|uniref:Uncharacterized protein n=2 Tax=Emiliania huxleyi TaxID=2903 RepID=A0A0D3I4S3_EMIH1|nr:hypothetical protein EMIHUDRAFT_258987 [Emiliania huxleyi CCMP1516]EOD06258.1 hypothetical protein EMIHUDRAFT_258987 [Emiliania huxleyi CCMP1516]|eukprot:XP_005758687.1 hypothetical protein EMIHUDRAFT_258987 [Emiliania huxleyi CCMP1516]
MRSPLPFPCVPDRPYKILLVQVGTLSFSHPSFGVSVLFILYSTQLRARSLAAGRRASTLRRQNATQELARCCGGGGSDADCRQPAPAFVASYGSSRVSTSGLSAGHLMTTMKYSDRHLAGLSARPPDRVELTARALSATGPAPASAEG